MPDTLDIELLRTLVAIVDTGGFGLAAKAVHRTQSAVSMQMKRLEESIDQPLFEKQGRRQVLTPAGQNLLLYARRIVNLQDEAIATLKSPDVHGEVRLGVSDDYVMGLMPPILAGFAERHPNVHIRLDSKTSAQLIAATAQGDLDFSLVNIPQEDLEHECLLRESLVWVTSSRHLAHEQRPVPIAVEATCAWAKWAQKALDHAGIHYRIAYSTFSFGGIAAITESGLAVAVMSQSSVPAGFRVLSERDGYPALPSISIGLVQRSNALTPAAHRLADTIRECFDSRLAKVA